MGTNSQKRISVCIAAYRPNDYLLTELESIMPQLSDCDEVIISEDYSIESHVYESVKRKWGGVKILINKHKNPWQRWGGDIKGYAVTQNFLNALQHASGKYIFLADQDDVWASDRIKEVLQCLKRHEGTLVVCNASLIDGEGETIEQSIHYKNPLNSKFPIVNCLKKPPFIGCALAFDRSLLNFCLPFPKKLNTHDTWITLCAVLKRKIVIIEKPLYLYRIHSNNVSRNMKNSILFKLVYQLYLLKEILWKILLK